MTHTVALLPLPRVAWDFIADAMEQAGYDNHLVTDDGHGGFTVMLDMAGIGLIPAGDASDRCINSGNLSDLLVQVGEDAFRAGHKAAQDGLDPDKGWDRYEVPDDIHELQAQL